MPRERGASIRRPARRRGIPCSERSESSVTGLREGGRRGGGGVNGAACEHGVNYFSCASMGLKPPAQRGRVRVTAVCLLPYCIIDDGRCSRSNRVFLSTAEGKLLPDPSGVMILTRHHRWDYPPLLRHHRSSIIIIDPRQRGRGRQHR